jgi:hypothetical protein
MSETIIDTIDLVIPSIIRANCLCASCGDSPYQKLLIPDYALTWALLDRNSPECIRVVTAAMVAVWKAEGIDWQQRAVINLKVASRELWTHRKLRQDGSIGMAIMMHDDGFGSSRILLRGYLQQQFPAGYYVAIPDRRIGIVTPRNLSLRERQETEETIESYYNTGSTPIGSQLFAPEDLIPKHDGEEN